MSEAETLEVAVVGDRIRGEDLQDSIDRLLALADTLDAAKAASTDVEEIQAIGRTQQKLRSRAMSLVDRQIDLIAGQARVTADHIDAATKAADDAIAKISAIRTRLQKIGKLLDFFAAVLTGNGQTIVDAAFELKDSLAA
jgi:hypothetical protein